MDGVANKNHHQTYNFSIDMHHQQGDSKCFDDDGRPKRTGIGNFILFITVQFNSFKKTESCTLVLLSLIHILWCV